MTDMKILGLIQNGEAVIGIEMGSTRIKAVLIDHHNTPIAAGEYAWENTLADGVWTYALDDVWVGLQACFADLQKNVEAQYGEPLCKVKAIGVSGMMHGYLVFDAKEKLLTPFRTWRNNSTGPAAKALSALFDYPIPQRWSIAHLYQAMLNKEEHVESIAHMTTLAGYVHWKLTGFKVTGVGEASGIFPIDIATQNYNSDLLHAFEELTRPSGCSWTLNDLLPEVLVAGHPAGQLTAEGALLLDPAGNLQEGIILCPPEGDAGTGMVATNSVGVRTGNVSAGTSVFAMVVLEKELSRVHPEIDLVTTPDGKLVGMAHSNNCSSDLDAWIQLLGEATEALGLEVTASDLYGRLLPLALEGDADCGGLLSYGYISGEHMTGFSEGRPLFVRSSDSNFTLANFMRSHLFSALCALRTGLNILMEEEQVVVDEIRGHGGFFKTEVGQRVMAAATGTPVSVLETAGEGGAWGIALLASFACRSKREASLPEFLNEVFAASMGDALDPTPSDAAGFNAYFERYHKGLFIEQAAVDCLS